MLCFSTMKKFKKKWPLKITFKGERSFRIKAHSQNHWKKGEQYSSLCTKDAWNQITRSIPLPFRYFFQLFFIFFFNVKRFEFDRSRLLNGSLKNISRRLRRRSKNVENLSWPLIRHLSMLHLINLKFHLTFLELNWKF
jgi:hypothetical protein